MTPLFQSLGLPFEAAWLVATVIGILLIAFPVMLGVALVIYADRKIWASMALRKGPNVVGPFGILQSLLAISSLGVYGTVIAGWSSNSKYPFFSAMRASAQMISYEVSIGFILICVVLWAGTFNLDGIVQAQKHHVWLINGYVANPLLFPMWVMFLISGMAETQRAPFDLTEAESELVAGYQTEYSSMAFALYWLGEYANVLLMCALNATLFFGGYLPPLDWAPLYYVPGLIWLLLKICFFFFIFSWVKATVPRYRYDQLMRLGWKVFLPVSLFWVFLVSGYLMLTGHFA